ncbi:hypothetical protein [Rhodovibrio sodomensis]|nr:hypothetical protein [Rhodovibrio sodomensis]
MTLPSPLQALLIVWVVQTLILLAGALRRATRHDADTATATRAVSFTMHRSDPDRIAVRGDLQTAALLATTAALPVAWIAC